MAPAHGLFPPLIHVFSRAARNSHSFFFFVLLALLIPAASPSPSSSSASPDPISVRSQPFPPHRHSASAALPAATLTTANGNYPRTLQLRSGQWLTCVGGPAPDGSGPGLQLYRGDPPISNRTVSPSTWTFLATIQRPGATTEDLANCFVVEDTRSDQHQQHAPHRRQSSAPLPLLVFYRHHYGCESGRPFCRNYTIATQRSTDGGGSWQPPSILNSSTCGLWEPMAIVLPCGGASHSSKATPALAVFYSQELEPPPAVRRSQDIVVQTALDAEGRRWTPPRTVMHVPQTRSGMPGAALLADGSLVLVAERLVGWSYFAVYYARSFDHGSTWNETGLVYHPNGPSTHPHNAGAPQVAVSPVSGLVYVSMMTNDDDPVPPPWVDGAYSKVAVSTNTGAGGEPLRFPARPELTVAAPNSYWPAVFSAAGHIWAEYGNSSGCFITTNPLDNN